MTHIAQDIQLDFMLTCEPSRLIKSRPSATVRHYEFVVATLAKKASKVRNAPNPNGGSPRRHAGNYDLTATVNQVTAVLNADIAQNADAATIKTVKD